MNSKEQTLYDPSWVQRFFDARGSEEWSRLTRSPFAEISLFLHLRVLEQFVGPGIDVLEIGAGSGRFTLEIVKLGASVLVADLSLGQLQANRINARDLGFSPSVKDWLQMDVCDMRQIESASIGCVVAFGGVLSYVFEGLPQALRECHRVLKPGGVLLGSVMSRWGTLHTHLAENLASDEGGLNEVIETGNVTTKNSGKWAHQCHLFTSAELVQALITACFDGVRLRGSGALSAQWDQLLRRLRRDEAEWKRMLQLEEKVSTEPPYVEMGTHLIFNAIKSQGKSARSNDVNKSGQVAQKLG